MPSKALRKERLLDAPLPQGLVFEPGRRVTTSHVLPFRVESGARMLRLKLARIGGDAGDTIAGDVHFYGLRTWQRSHAEQVLSG